VWYEEEKVQMKRAVSIYQGSMFLAARKQRETRYGGVDEDQ
jgi:hypothetical protein